MQTINPSTALRVNSERSRTIKFYTLGCKANQYDTQSIRERFLSNGYKEINNGRSSSNYLINTCTVTAAADRKSHNIIRHYIRENPRAKIIITGCLVEKDNASLAKIKGIDFIISKRFFPDGISNFSGHTRAFLKIQDGCNNFCAYCKVPLVRGASRSRQLEEIISEAKRLVKNGFKEIVLTGICLGAYGQDLSDKTNLVSLIEALEKIEGLLRIRLSSIEAGDVNNDLIKKMVSSPKLCRHLHIPIQSGDDEILKNMNRSYRAKDYLKLIRKIKKYIADIAITTDILVGFPSETETNFQNTVNLIKKVTPLRTHIFPYSPRQGTLAAEKFGKKQIDYKIIQSRLEYLKKIADHCSLNFKRKFLKKTMNVLIEERADKQGFWQGHTDNYIKVLVKSKLNLKNKLVRVRLKEIQKAYIFAGLP